MLLSLMADDSSAETHCLWSFLHDNLNKSFVSRSSVEPMTYGQGHEALARFVRCRAVRHVLFSSEGLFMFQG
ncbi:MAG: hypothetical protein OJF50_005683 [Nitrospira sp.]|nr:hypothetical protein [Nitrospira sp.]